VLVEEGGVGREVGLLPEPAEGLLPDHLELRPRVVSLQEPQHQVGRSRRRVGSLPHLLPQRSAEEQLDEVQGLPEAHVVLLIDYLLHRVLGLEGRLTRRLFLLLGYHIEVWLVLVRNG
jgi:hypothetical protein